MDTNKEPSRPQGGGGGDSKSLVQIELREKVSKLWGIDKIGESMSGEGVYNVALVFFEVWGAS